MVLKECIVSHMPKENQTVICMPIYKMRELVDAWDKSLENME